MSESAESVVRQFLAAWKAPDIKELLGFFSDDAVYIDGPRGVHRGAKAIETEFKEQLSMGFPNVRIEVKSLVAQGDTVMMERVDNFSLAGKPFSMDVMAVFRVGPDGRITRWRDSYDLKSTTDQIEAAGIPVP